MASYCQPSSLFCTRLPHDIVLHVAQELATIDILGPPRHLPPLLRVCRYIHDILADHWRALLAKVFRSKFDTSAAARRLGPSALSNSALAFQLKKQTLALKRLRYADLNSPNLLSDLWTAYIMFLENDGRNYTHLMEYARLDALVDRFMDNRLWTHRQRLGTGWPLEITPNSLVVWLFWFTMTPARLRAMDLERRGKLMDLFRPFAIAALQYSPFFAPDNHFDFPINESLRENADFPQGTAFALYPMYRDPTMTVERVFHYGRDVPIMAPVLGLGAKMSFIMLAEAVPYEPPSVLPIDRAHADPADGVRPTQADFIEWASIRGVQLYQPGEWDWLSALKPEQQRLETDFAWRRELRSTSSKFDNDWNRLTGCFDPYRDLPLKRVVYTFGSIAGMFAGRMQVPEFFGYRDMVNGTNMPELALFPSVVEYPVYVRLREHHCINPEVPIPTGGTQHGFDDGVLNAYLPKTFEYHHFGNTLRINVPGTHVVARYEDYIAGKPNSHNPTTCTKCISRYQLEEEELRERIAAHTRAASGEAPTDEEMPDQSAVVDSEEADFEPTPRARRGSTSSQDSHVSYWYGSESDPDGVLSTSQMLLEYDPETEALIEELMIDGIPDDYEEYIDDECNGIEDIIITGETLPHHGDAWYHYRYYGRVRKWDGLIVLVRVPIFQPQAGKTIFRGYMVGNRNFVGSWRSYAENIQAIPVEGPFALSRVEEISQPIAAVPTSAPASPLPAAAAAT